jgi:hypothetical protein
MTLRGAKAARRLGLNDLFARQVCDAFENKVQLLEVSIDLWVTDQATGKVATAASTATAVDTVARAAVTLATVVATAKARAGEATTEEAEVTALARKVAGLPTEAAMAALREELEAALRSQRASTRTTPTSPASRRASTSR